MSSRLLRLMPLFAAGLCLMTGAAFPTVFTAYVLEPVATALWAAWRVAASVDERVYWILLVCLCSLFTIRAFSSRGGRRGAAERFEASPQPGRAERWQELFRNAASSEDGDRALRVSLANLIMATLARPDEPAPSDLEQALTARHVSLPPQIRLYLKETQAGSARSRRRAAWLLKRGRRRAEDAAVDQVLEWMESAMEMDHDEQ